VANILDAFRGRHAVPKHSQPSQKRRVHGSHEGADLPSLVPQSDRRGPGQVVAQGVAGPRELLETNKLPTELIAALPAW